MQRLEYNRYGGPDVVHFSPFTLPAPGADQIVVRVAAASINPMDWKIRNGDMKMLTGWRFPRALGTDFSGTIEMVGANVTHLKHGDTVLGTVSMKDAGAFAPRLITSQHLVVKKPAQLSFAEAACLPIAGVTAWLALVAKARLQSGQKLFINGASGAVGQAAIAIAHDIGAEITGRVGATSMACAQSLGLARTLDHAAALPASLDGYFDVVFDCHGSLSLGEGNRLLKSGGLVIDIVPTAAKFLLALLSPSRTTLFANLQAENLQQVINLAAASRLTLPIARTITLAEAPALLAEMERGKRLNGKVIIGF